ncbi:hypothetical protein PINS_up000882 [Pythium insidiosum]|nr:hypothetical protein PINS_up000882 [Pythium insidiosum]
MPQASGSAVWPQPMRSTAPAARDQRASFGSHGFSSSQRDRSDAVDLEIEALVQSVDEQLSAIDPFVSDTKPRSTKKEEAQEQARAVREVPTFLSHHPVYQESVIAKRLQLYERQLAIREQQLARLQQVNAHAHSTIHRLQEDLAAQRKAFEDAQNDWEEEKTALLRFRGSAAQDQSQKNALMRSILGQGALVVRNRVQDEDAEQRRQQQWRLQMLTGAADAQAQLDDIAPLQLSSSRSGRTWKRLTMLFQRRLVPFATDIRQIEARFGYSVASYFRFFRWIIFAFLVVALPAFALLVTHLIVLVRANAARATADHSWRRFVGVAPRFLLLSGYVESEALAYTSVLVAMEVALLALTIHKWVREDRATKTVEAMDAGDKKPTFSKLVLNAWDASLTTKEQVDDLQRAIEEQLKLAMEEERLSETLRHRTKKEWYLLYARRVLAFLVYLTVQASSWYLIIVLTTQSTEIQTWIAVKANVLSPYVSTIVPAAVTVINAALPTIISLLTQLERWDHTGFAIKAMVTRLYLAKVLNVIIQLASYALLLDPYLLTATTSIFDIFKFDGPVVRRNVMLAFKPDVFRCRAEQAASGLLTLVITDFVIGKIATVASPAVIWSVKVSVLLFTRWREHQRKRHAVVPAPGSQDLANSPVKLSLSSLVDRTEFQVPQKMVALLYSCTITLVAIPLAPSVAILALALHIINFKFDKTILMVWHPR